MVGCDTYGRTHTSVPTSVRRGALYLSDVFHGIDRIWYVMNVAAETEAQSNAKIAGNVRHLIVSRKKYPLHSRSYPPKLSVRISMLQIFKVNQGSRLRTSLQNGMLASIQVERSRILFRARCWQIHRYALSIPSSPGLARVAMRSSTVWIGSHVDSLVDACQLLLQ
jgi:hypothetical protein